MLSWTSVSLIFKNKTILLNPAAILHSSVLSCRPDDALTTKILTLEYSDCKVLFKKALSKAFFFFY